MDAVPNVQDIEERAALLDVERGPGDYGATILPVNDANGECSMDYKSCWAGVLGIWNRLFWAPVLLGLILTNVRYFL